MLGPSTGSEALGLGTPTRQAGFSLAVTRGDWGEVGSSLAAAERHHRCCLVPASSSQSSARDCPGQAVLQAWAAVTGPPPESSWGQRLQERGEGGVWAGSGEAGRKKVFQGPIPERGEQEQGRPGGSTGPASRRPGEKRAR